MAYSPLFGSVYRTLSILASGATGQMQYHVLTNTAEELERLRVCIVWKQYLSSTCTKSGLGGIL
jgi:hypothetical protein